MKYSINLIKRTKRDPRLNEMGIFLVRCVPTGDTYIGSTNRSFRIQWKEFRKQMRNLHNRRISRRIRNLWQAYGDEGFEFEREARCFSSSLCNLVVEILEITVPTPEKKHYYIGLYSSSLNYKR